MPKLRAARSDVESQLESFSAEIAQHPYRDRQLTAVRYYIRDVIAGAQSAWLESHADGVTNYVELLDAIEWWRKNEPVVLVTFNYDTLLELACQSVLQRPLDSIDAYAGDDGMPIFKLHGSTAWYQELQYFGRNAPAFQEDRTRDLWLIEKSGPNLEATSTYGLYGSDEHLSNRFEGAAVSIPFANKTAGAFNCPIKHIRMLEGLMPHVTHLLIIGWRGREAHFHKLWRDATGMTRPPLHRRLVKTLVVDRTGESASEVLQTLKEQMGVGDAEVSGMGGGFSGFIDSGGLATFVS